MVADWLMSDSLAAMSADLEGDLEDGSITEKLIAEQKLGADEDGESNPRQNRTVTNCNRLTSLWIGEVEMTVAELIEKLKEYPQTAKVLVSGYDVIEMYDYDENLELEYMDSQGIPDLCYSEIDNILTINMGGEDDDYVSLGELEGD